MALTMPKATYAYDFSALAPNLQTLYYNISNGSAVVTYPGQFSYDPYAGNSRPTGNLVIPDSVTYGGITYAVTSIGDYAFDGCSGLTTVLIPNTVTSIDNYAFAGCSGLTEMWMKPTTPPILGGASSICGNIIYLFVPYGSYAAYTNAGTNYTRHIIYCDTVFVTLNINDTTRGYVIGYDSVYANPVQCTITAIPNYGYHFARWGSFTTDSIYILSGNLRDFVLDVYFDFNQYTIMLSADTSIYGTVSGAGSFDYLSERTITANANHGYHFTHWSDGDTNNPRILTLTQDTSLYAIFQPNRYFVQGVSNDTAMGTVIGSDTADYLDTVTLTAVPNYGYQFSIWLYNDDNSWDVNNPLTAIATDEITYTAYFWPNVYSITVNADTSIHGSCIGGGSYTYLSERTISATANHGYHFTHWSDGDTNNPRTITLTQDTQFVAFFDKNQYTVAAVTNDSIRGVVSGSAIVDYLDSVSLTATSNYGYHFQRWSDYNTDNPRTVVATDNISLTAHFYSNQYTIALSVDTLIHGMVSGAGSYNYLSNRPISANANYGYHFTHWNNGDTNNPRTITLTQDTQFVAYFEKNTYTLTFQSDNTDLGIVNTNSESGEYLDSSMLIYTTPIAHYHFTHWNDGSTENPRRFVFDDNRTYTASFAIDVHTVGVQVDNIAHGTVSGAGSREYGQPITVSATPYSGYQFTHWSDGSTYNPYTFAVLNDTVLTAFFVADGEPWQDTVVVYDTVFVDVHDTTYVDVIDTMYIDVQDTTYIDVHDTTYIDVHDTTYVDVHDTTYIDVHDTTYIDVHDTTYIDVHDTSIVVDTLTLTQYDTVTNTVYDTVYNYIYDTVTITDTLWLYDTITIYDTVYITEQGIDEVEALNAKIYSNNGQIVVEGIYGVDVHIYDALGRQIEAVKRPDSQTIRFNVPSTGTYMVKIGNAPARRIVVVR